MKIKYKLNTIYEGSDFTFMRGRGLGLVGPCPWALVGPFPMVLVGRLPWALVGPLPKALVGSFPCALVGVILFVALASDGSQ